MTTSIDTILSYNSIDFSPFEIRGAKSGVSNARTTGPVYATGSYIPSNNILTGDASFTHDSSIVTALTLNYNYVNLDTTALRIGDVLTVNNSPFMIQELRTYNSVALDKDVGPMDGMFGVSLALAGRDYVIEPDVDTNTLYGEATFTKGSNVVQGTGTFWGEDLIVNDFIKSGNFQQFYKIVSVNSSGELEIAFPFQGSTITGDYTGKKWIVGNTDVRYATNDVKYDSQKSEWTYKSLSGDHIPTSTNYTPLADGIHLRFTHTLSSVAPDIMDVATVTNKTLSRKTIYDTFQYSLPVVPYSDTFTLFINNVQKDQYPSGNQDYVLSFSQNPIYMPPPPPEDRQVANVMFLKGVKDIQLDTALTTLGQFYMTDSSGNNLTGLMSGSEQIYLNDALQVAYKDYIFEQNSGLVEVVDSVMNEPVVKYVAVNYNSQIDYGLSIYLNSVKQRISFPLRPTDTVFFQPDTGQMKPQFQDHPGPTDVYEINYMASASDSRTETFLGYPGQSVFKTGLYPIQQGSLLLKDSNGYLTEGEDYVVGHLTGSILMSNALTGGNTFTAVYTPLSKQVNDLTYTDGTAYCTVNDSRLIVRDAVWYGFTFENKAINAPDVTEIVLNRVYNETRKAAYDIIDYDIQGNSFTLPITSVNQAIGLSSTDIVVADYRLTQEIIEYAPAQMVYMTLPLGSRYIYLEGLNLASAVFTGSLINLSVTDAADQYLYGISNVLFDGTGTRVSISNTLPVDLINPDIFITDSSVTFIPYAVTPEPLISGSNVLVFKDRDRRNIFRSGIVIEISGDYYQVSRSSYDSGNTSVTLSSSAVKDYLNVTLLKYSDSPVYLEGQTEINPSEPIVALSQQPAFIMSYGNGTLKITSDSSKIVIDGTNFLYSSYPTMGSLSTAINGVSSLTATTYVPSWKSDKIVAVTDVPVFPGSNTVFYANNALRYGGIDTTNFSLSGSGLLTLTNPLKKSDRYSMDYLGLRFLDTAQVKYSVKYFSVLPAGSKVSASFQFDNLDQFYVQVIGQKDFLETVTKPRMAEEANQLNGNVGQGGDVAGDSETGPSSGGSAGDEYRRQDTEVECRIFKKVYDFFQDRLNAYKVELDAGMGLRLFNTDSTFSEEQQLAGTDPINRVFPINYGGLAPKTCNPLTGYFFETGAIFVKGDSIVKNFYAGSSWLSQLSPGGFIARADSSVYYGIRAVNSNSELVLDRTFEEASTRKRPDRYQACGLMPLYDDDGYIGPKHISSSVNQTKDWGLVDGDKFICTIDGSDSTYVFEDSASKFFPLPSYVAYAIQPPPSRLTTSQVIEQLNTIPGLTASYSTVLDSEEPYGYRTTLVLKTDGTYNKLTLSNSATAVSKLGFTPGAVSLGNWDRTGLYSSYPEMALGMAERDLRWLELNYLTYMSDEQNKVDRIPDELSYVTGVIQEELFNVNKEIVRLEAEVASTGVLIEEPMIVTFNDSSTAHLNATNSLMDATATRDYDSSSLVMDWKWPIDFMPQVNFITNIDGQSSVMLIAPSTENDIRILNTTIGVGTYTPKVFFQDNNFEVIGTWTGWDYNPPINNEYSFSNQVEFTIDPFPLMTLQAIYASSAYYTVDSTALNLFWERNLDSSAITFNYSSYPTVGIIVENINSGTDFTATCDPSHYGWSSRAFQISTSTIAPVAEVNMGLRDIRIVYQTISDRLLNHRIDYVTNRFNYLAYTRLPYLSFRETQIRTNLASEELLRTPTGAPGDVYGWANNRFNRRQGCYARLKQIENMIASNKSALNINRSFM